MRVLLGLDYRCEYATVAGTIIDKEQSWNSCFQVTRRMGFFVDPLSFVVDRSTPIGLAIAKTRETLGGSADDISRALGLPVWRDQQGIVHVILSPAAAFPVTFLVARDLAYLLEDVEKEVRRRAADIPIPRTAWEVMCVARKEWGVLESRALADALALCGISNVSFVTTTVARTVSALGAGIVPISTIRRDVAVWGQTRGWVQVIFRGDSLPLEIVTEDVHPYGLAFLDANRCVHLGERAGDAEPWVPWVTLVAPRGIGEGHYHLRFILDKNKALRAWLSDVENEVELGISSKQ